MKIIVILGRNLKNLIYKNKWKLQSWTNVSRQIHKLKQKRFFCGMFYSWVFAIFLRENVKIWLLGGKLGTRHQVQAFQVFSWNFLILQDPKSWVVRQLVRQLIHLLSADNNLVSFYLWWKEIVLKRKKIYKCFDQNCSSK